MNLPSLILFILFNYFHLCRFSGVEQFSRVELNVVRTELIYVACLLALSVAYIVS